MGGWAKNIQLTEKKTEGRRKKESGTEIRETVSQMQGGRKIEIL